MLTSSSIKKGLYCRPVPCNKLIFLQELFSSTFPGDASRKINKFQIIVDKPLTIVPNLSILDNYGSPEFASDLKTAAHGALFLNKVKPASLHSSSQCNLTCSNRP